MRSATSGQLTVLDSVSYDTHLRVLVADADGTMREYTNQAGLNWIDLVEIDVNIDQFVSQATIQLRRDVLTGSGVLSLSPLRSDSTLNRNAANAYAAAIDAGRAVQIFVATMASGVSPSSGDWQNLFEGTLDDFAIEHSPLVLTARDHGGALQDQFIEVETNYGSDAGVPIETVMQSILDDWMGPGAVTLYCPASPGFLIRPYTQSRVAVLDALQTLAGLIGWDVRYRWDSGTSQWRLTLQAIPRSNATPDRTITPARYLDVQTLKIGRTDVRNVVWVWYTESTTGLRGKIESKDNASIARYGRLWMETDEAVDSPIDTLAEAQAFGDAMLADLKDPKADQTIEEHFDWTVELNDVHLYKANGVHYDSDQTWAVVSYRHTLGLGKSRTVVAVRGKPCGRFLEWKAKRNIPNSTAANAGPSLVVNAIVSADSVSITVVNTGLLTLSTDGGITFGDPGIPAFPYVVARPNATAGFQSQRYVFKATLNGQSVTHPVDIPATQSTVSTVTPPPDTAYATPALAIPSVQNVHAQHAGLVSLTNLPAARTEFDQNCRFKFDVTNVDRVLIGVNVQTVGHSGSRVSLEYLDPTTALWNLVGDTDIYAPIDVVGLQEGSGALVATLTGRLLFRVVTLGGDGIVTPVIGNLYVEFIPVSGTKATPTAVPLYLRNLYPASAPAGSAFPMSVAMPGSNKFTKATGWDIPLSLLPTKGSTVSESVHLGFAFTSLIGNYDAFSRVFLSPGFSAAQSIPAGNWEFGAVGTKQFTPGDAVQMLAIYVLRDVGGVWSKVGTIYDQNDPTGEASLVYASQRVEKRVMAGQAVAALAGDVLVLETWMWVRQGAGQILNGDPDALADVYFDGPNDIPVSSADGAAWSLGNPASYLKPPVTLAIGTGSGGITCDNTVSLGPHISGLSGLQVMGDDFGLWNCYDAFRANAIGGTNPNYPLFVGAGDPSWNDNVNGGVVTPIPLSFLSVVETSFHGGHRGIASSTNTDPITGLQLTDNAVETFTPVQYRDIWARVRFILPTTFDSAYSGPIDGSTWLIWLTSSSTFWQVLLVAEADGHGGKQLVFDDGSVAGAAVVLATDFTSIATGGEIEVVIHVKDYVRGSTAVSQCWIGPTGALANVYDAIVTNSPGGAGTTGIAVDNYTFFWNTGRHQGTFLEWEFVDGSIHTDPFNVLGAASLLAQGRATATATLRYLHHTYHPTVSAHGQATVSANLTSVVHPTAAGQATATATVGYVQKHVTVAAIGQATVTAALHAKRKLTATTHGTATVAAVHT